MDLVVGNVLARQYHSKLKKRSYELHDLDTVKGLPESLSDVPTTCCVKHLIDHSIPHRRAVDLHRLRHELENVCTQDATADLYNQELSVECCE